MLNKDSAEPLYVQARNILLERINKNEYPPNEKIPSESQLCAEFGISRMTLRNVITELVRDGIIYRITGKAPRRFRERNLPRKVRRPRRPWSYK